MLVTSSFSNIRGTEVDFKRSTHCTLFCNYTLPLVRDMDKSRNTEEKKMLIGVNCALLCTNSCAHDADLFQLS